MTYYTSKAIKTKPGNGKVIFNGRLYIWKEKVSGRKAGTVSFFNLELLMSLPGAEL
jgi:hypothetical protein